MFQHLFFLMEVATGRDPMPMTVAAELMFQHLFFLMEVATHWRGGSSWALEYQVSTPFLPNGSRYQNDSRLQHWEIPFQHLFFLTEVATSYGGGTNSTAMLIAMVLKFQHLFFLTEVATPWKRSNNERNWRCLVSTPFLPNRSRYLA